MYCISNNYLFDHFVIESHILSLRPTSCIDLEIQYVWTASKICDNFQIKPFKPSGSASVSVLRAKRRHCMRFSCFCNLIELVRYFNWKVFIRPYCSFTSHTLFCWSTFHLYRSYFIWNKHFLGFILYTFCHSPLARTKTWITSLKAQAIHPVCIEH